MALLQAKLYRMRIEIHNSDFEPWAEVARHEHQLRSGGHGAAAVFVGTMRDSNEGDAVAAMQLEHYAGMTETHLEGIAKAAAEQYQLIDVLMLHRVGEIVPGNPIVVAAVWAEHRAEAIAACEQIVEYLKAEAPFWKKEILTDGASRWVERNTPGRAAGRSGAE